MDEKILFYEGSYYMFSNFAAFAVDWKGASWMTSEHAYQAAKFADASIQEKIRAARSAHDSKKIAKEHEESKRGDWNETKLATMEEILRAKLDQHPYILKKLMETEDMEIVEDSPKDSFWGRGSDHQGENHLGKLWMKIRDELKK